MLGREIRAQNPQEHELFAFSRAELDVRDSRALERAIRDCRPGWVVNASGFTSVDAAEVDVETAFAVNATAVGEMARLCRENHCRLLHFSTDYVFDGTTNGFYREDEVPRPLNAYGASKLAGEESIRGSGVRHLIIRSQWIYGVGGKSFVSTLLRRAREAMPTRVVDDQFGCTTYVADLAHASWRALDKALEGTFHIANRGRVSRFAVAQRLFGAFGASELVTACSAAEFPATARRPANTPLDVGKAEKALGYTLPTWEDAISRVLRPGGVEDTLPA